MKLEKLSREVLGQLETARKKKHTRLVCQLKKLPEVPVEIGRLTQLEELEISGTEITTLPAELGQLRRLRILRITHCPSLTALPPEIVQWPAMVSLAITHTALQALPGEIGNLTTLRQLDLRHNRITTLPAELAALEDLEELLLAHNPLQLPLTCLEVLTHLKRLDLSACGLAEFPESLCRLPNLETLELCGNTLTDLPDTLPQLLHLRELDLSDNARLTTLPAVAAELPALAEVRVERCFHLRMAPSRLLRAPRPALRLAGTPLGMLHRNIYARNEFGRTGLHAAAQGSLPSEHFGEMLALGADPNAVDRWGYTPLHEAVRTGNVENVRLLLEWGADPTHRAWLGPYAGDIPLGMIPWESFSRIREFEENLQPFWQACKEIEALLQQAAPGVPKNIRPEQHWEWPRESLVGSGKAYYEIQKPHGGAFFRMLSWTFTGDAEVGYWCTVEGQRADARPPHFRNSTRRANCLLCHGENIILLKEDNGVKYFCNTCGWILRFYVIEFEETFAP